MKVSNNSWQKLVAFKNCAVAKQLLLCALNKQKWRGRSTIAVIGKNDVVTPAAAELPDFLKRKVSAGTLTPLRSCC
jgi:hypothetical protein